MRKLFILLFSLSLSICFSQESSSQPEPFLAMQLKDFPNVRDYTYCSLTEEVIFSVLNYSAGNATLVMLSLVDGKWQDPQVLNFSGKYNDLEPYFSTDGLSLYFASNRPIDTTSSTPKDVDIWVSQREDISAPWAPPVNLGSAVNSSEDEFYPVITNSGNIYLTINKKGSVNKDDIYISEFKNGEYSEPTPVRGEVNTDGYEFNAYIDPNETFMIFSGYNREDGFGSGDLYISYHLESGDWSAAKNLGNNVNSDKLDYCPFVDIESKTLIFTSNRQNYAKPAGNMDIDQLRDWFKSKDGLSKLYKVDFSNWLNGNN